MNRETQTALTAAQATDKINAILERFCIQQKSGAFGNFGQVHNVQFSELTELYFSMCKIKLNVMFFLPGELGNECMTILYAPCIGCTVEIHSEPCVDLRWKVSQLDLKSTTYIN